MYLSDLHTHSIASGHGTTCTITDMAKAASSKGMKLLGITDHGPSTLASGTASYFRSLTYSPKRRFGIDLLYGIELNVLDASGHVDLEDRLLYDLDYAIVSMHPQTFHPGSREYNTEAFLQAMKHPCIKILGHADDPRYPLDYEALAESASEHGVLFEINEASLLPGSYRGDTPPQTHEILRCCKKHHLPILLSSDSHGSSHIGDFFYAEEFVHQALFPESQILNNQIPQLKTFLTTR